VKVLICGAGQVGSNIARQLAGENNEVTVIDHNEDLMRSLAESLDVKTIVGHAAHPDVLDTAGAAEADLLIAVTHSDEVNMIACQIGYSLFNIPTKIARVRDRNYLSPLWQDLYGNDNLPIDEIISPEYEVAQAVIRRLHEPGAVDMIPFADEKLRMIAVNCMPDSTFVNLPLHLVKKKLQKYAVAIMGVMNENDFIMPHEDMIFQEEDTVYFIAADKDIRPVMQLFGHEEKEARRIVILGGGNIGFTVAQELEEEEAVKVKIIEMSRKRAEEIAGKLSDTTVLEGSGLDREILMEANVNVAETFIAVTNDNEVNILSSLLAKRYGCQRVITLVNSMLYIPLLGSLGIDVIVNPRETTVSSILQHVRRGKIRGVHSIRDGVAEIIEAEAMETSKLVGKNLETLDLPKGVLLAAIVREDEVIIPDESVVIQEHDRVIMLTKANMIKTVEKIFSVGLEFF
jgi:trk system potassium uptake protein TrkA